jgi:hypothetical protein
LIGFLSECAAQINLCNSSSSSCVRFIQSVPKNVQAKPGNFTYVSPDPDRESSYMKKTVVISSKSVKVMSFFMQQIPIQFHKPNLGYLTTGTVGAIED